MLFGISSATVNVLVGAGIAIVSSAFVNWNQRRVMRDRFRRSLVHEVEHVGDTVESLLDHTEGQLDPDDVERTLVQLSTDLMDADLARVQKLTSSEIETVYEFYESARLVSTELERLRDGRDHDPDRLYREATEMVALRDEVTDDVTRSRLSRFTEWYKDLDSGRRGPTRE